MRERGLKCCSVTVQLMQSLRSLPVRERGLKFDFSYISPAPGGVAPCAGAWVEICHLDQGLGAHPSLPVRERGLKSIPVWPNTAPPGRSLCGSVG